MIDLGPELGETVPYYADKEVELIYHVPSLFPHHGSIIDEYELASSIGAILASNLVAIVWLEDPTDLLTLPSKFGCPSTLVYLCVIPLTGASNEGLYRIRIMVTAPPNSPTDRLTFSFGPLLDGMLLRREMLAPLIRSTAITASLHCLYNNLADVPVSPIAARAHMLLGLARKYESVDQEASNAFEMFYSRALFPDTSTANAVAASSPKESDELDRSFSKLSMDRPSTTSSAPLFYSSRSKSTGGLVSSD